MQQNSNTYIMTGFSLREFVYIGFLLHDVVLGFKDCVNKDRVNVKYIRSKGLPTCLWSISELRRDRYTAGCCHLSLRPCSYPILDCSEAPISKSCSFSFQWMKESTKHIWCCMYLCLCSYVLPLATPSDFALQNFVKRAFEGHTWCPGASSAPCLRPNPQPNGSTPTRSTI